MAMLGQIWPEMAILGTSKAPQGHFWGVQRDPSGPPRCGLQCSTMFNQCSTNLGQLGSPMAMLGQIWPEMAILGTSKAPQGHFWGVQSGPSGPPRCGLQCSTKFNQCSTNLGQLGSPMAM